MRRASVLLALLFVLGAKQAVKSRVDVARVTIYDTAVCGDDEVCIHGNGDGYFASMERVGPEWYGRMAACPPRYFGRTIYLHYVDLEVYCGDNFGSWNGQKVRATDWHDYWGWYNRVDVYWPLAEQGAPDWAGYYVIMEER